MSWGSPASGHTMNSGRIQGACVDSSSLRGPSARCVVSLRRAWQRLALDRVLDTRSRLGKATQHLSQPLMQKQEHAVVLHSRN